MLTEKIYTLFLKNRRICTDSRKAEPGDLFFALSGENFDGNLFAAQALEKGAIAAVCDGKNLPADDRIIKVPNSLEALQDLARMYRKSLDIPVLVLTGSNGKTTTKELIASVLQTELKVAVTRGNLNNHIGVPLTLLAIPPDAEMAVVEAGANHIGEIAFLSEIARPTHGLITNIGEAHLEGFGSLEGVRRGKFELFEFVQKTGGTAFINSSDPKINVHEFEFENECRFGDDNDFFNLQLIESEPFVKYSRGRGHRGESRLNGLHNFRNITAALCIADYFGIDPEAADAAIAAYSPTNNRSQLIEGKNTVLADAYNANPASMRAALLSFAAKNPEEKHLILGQMGELGDFADENHREIGELAQKSGFRSVILIGKSFSENCTETENCRIFNEKTEAELYLKNLQPVNQQFMLKASRSMSLESLLPLLID